MLKRQQSCCQKTTKASSDRKAKRCGAGLETKAVNCSTSSPRSSRAVSPDMCINKASIPQKKHIVLRFTNFPSVD